MFRAWIAGLLGAGMIIVPPLDARAQTAREGLIEEPIKIAATVFRSKVNFDALIIRPQGPGPFPLAVITHGSIEDITVRSNTRPASLSTPAYEMARRGWAAVSFMRLGYGATGGEQLDAPGRCTNPQYEDPGLATAEQIRAVIEALRGQAFIDGERVVAMGVSAGGFGTLALTTLPVPGLRAVINFAGGRGSNAKGDVCSVGELTRAVGRFGSRAKVPSLWIYADNDKWFVPAVANTMFAAYAAGGSKAEKLFTPASGEDGHGLMSRGAHVHFWAPTLDTFLRAHGLPTWSTDEMTLNNQPGAGTRAKDDLARYLSQGGEKAFALSSSGSFGWRSGRTATEEAKRSALESCGKDGAKDCRLVFVNFERVK